MRILFVENHPTFAEIVCKKFLSNHAVTVAPSLQTARSALARHEFDLVIVDYDLDDGKGDELIREFATGFPQLPFIAASSHEQGNSALLKAGAVAACLKMNFEQIHTVLARIGKSVQ